MTNIDTTAGQTGRSTRGRTPVHRIAVNGEALDVVVIEAQLLFAKNQHDLVTMTLSSDTMMDTEGLLDQPIFFTFGQAPRVESYYGYIVHVQESSAKPQSPGYSAVNALQFSLLISGATRVMQGGRPRFWRDRTISGAIQELVQVNQLGYVGQDHPHKWKTLAQTNDSDWAAVVRYAQRLGWDVYNRFGVVMCYDPEKLFKERGVYTHLLAGTEDDHNTQDTRLILEFEASDESDETPESIGYKMGFFNGSAPQVISQEGTFQRYRFNTDRVIRDKSEADIYEAAFNLADSYDTQRAAARLYGEADLYPGMAVTVTTSNARIYRGRFDGRWLIDAVTHKMDRGSFQTQVRLSRPGKALFQDTPYRPFWDVEGRSKPSMYFQAVDSGFSTTGERTTLGKWTSTWASLTVGMLIGGTR